MSRDYYKGYTGEGRSVGKIRDLPVSETGGEGEVPTGADELIDLLEKNSEFDETPEDLLARKEMGERIFVALKKVLSPSEAEVIKKYFGLGQSADSMEGYDKDISLTQLGKITYGRRCSDVTLSGQAIHLIINKAVKKLASSWRAKEKYGLADFKKTK